jgi:chemotaxis regulatin CheY-phosphate phosphatase CheZ
MTQEELDALMAGDLDLDSISDTDDENEHVEKEEKDSKKSDEGVYSVAEDDGIYPPPATEEHKVVHQLDDVTRDSEQKASEIFDALDAVMNNTEEALQELQEIQKKINGFEELFATLHEKFPHINRFERALEESKDVNGYIENIVNLLETSNDQILSAMDTMQYQDIHRQKIERVINIMRALSKYMSLLFEGQVDDEKRVKSAKHIEGDSTDNVISNDDIEALIAQFGK